MTTDARTAALAVLDALPPWSRWYRQAREDMAFRYGLRRIPVDRYKEMYALGETPHGASKRIYDGMRARGEGR